MGRITVTVLNQGFYFPLEIYLPKILLILKKFWKIQKNKTD